jgi:hypothetical protein
MEGEEEIGKKYDEVGKVKGNEDEKGGIFYNIIHCPP